MSFVTESPFGVRALRTPKLDGAEELELARRFRLGDATAGDRIVEANVRHVVTIAMRFRGYGIPVEDLVSEGNVGIMRALRKFDPSANCRFVTYAGPWIRAFMFRYIEQGRSVVRVPPARIRKRVLYRMARDRFVLEARGIPAEDLLTALAELYGVKRAVLEAAIREVGRDDASMDAPLDGFDGMREITLHDRTASTAPSPEDAAIANDSVVDARIAFAIRRLQPRERDIVRSRLMSDGDKAESLESIGDRYGISKERVRQIELAVKHKLRDMLQDVVTA